MKTSKFVYFNTTAVNPAQITQIVPAGSDKADIWLSSGHKISLSDNTGGHLEDLVHFLTEFIEEAAAGGKLRHFGPWFDRKIMELRQVSGRL